MPPPGANQRANSKFIVFEQFEKMNTQSVRQALSEKELAWLENLQPIAPNNFVTVPGPLVPNLANISETISSQFYANLGTVDYIITFTTVGSGWAINIATGIATRFAAPGTFSNPDMTVWQSSTILFADATAGYSAWNGTVFVRQGGVSPAINLTAGGSGYTSPPSVSITGGSGSGATAVATIGTPQVTAVNVITGGSQYGPPPNVVFTGGGGTGAAATANIDPRGLTSFTIDTGGAYANAGVPGIQFSGGGGSGAAATAHMVLTGLGFYTVQYVTITNPGSNYASAPSVTFFGGTPIGGQNAAGHCTVGDGRVLSITVTAGGSGYTSAPAVSFTGGGSGTGATAAAVIGGSFVATVTLTNPGGGYLSGDALTVGFSGGGGTGAAANAHVWPFVSFPTTLAIFQGRVFMAKGRLVIYTGTGGFDDFTSGNASASFTINDSDLVHGVTALRSFNNYLFIMGDQSVKQIGNLSLNAAGNITLFTILTLSSDQGTIFPLSCGSYNRVFMFLNSNGVYAVFGSSVQKISDDLDGIFKNINFSQKPQVAIIDINGIHNIGWLVSFNDPASGFSSGFSSGFGGGTRSIILVFNGRKWFVVNQGLGIVAMATAATLASGKTLTFGSSGNDLTQILADPTSPVLFRLQTALSHHGNAVQRKKIIDGGIAASLGTGLTGNITVNYDTENGSVSKIYPLVAGFQLPSGASGVEGSGRYLGMTITGTLAGLTLTNTALEEQENALWK